MTAHLPELDDLQGDKQADGHQVGVQDPERDQQDEGVGSPISVVALHDRRKGLVSTLSLTGKWGEGVSNGAEDFQ